MKRDKKKLFIYLGVLFLTVILAYKLPRDSRLIIEHIIPPIESADNDSVFYPSSIVIIVIFLIGLSGISNLERFKDRNNFLIFIVVLIVVLPLMNLTLEVTRTNYHWIRGDGLKAIDLEDATTSTSYSEDEIVINIKLELKDYSRKNNRFKIKVYLPEIFTEYSGEEFYDLENTHTTHGRRNKYIIEDKIVIKSLNEDDIEKIYNSKWYREDIKYQLYNDGEKSEVIDFGL